MASQLADADERRLVTELRDRFGGDLRSVARLGPGDAVRHLDADGPADGAASGAASPPDDRRLDDAVRRRVREARRADGPDPGGFDGRFLTHEGALVVDVPLDAGAGLVVWLDAGADADVGAIARTAAKHR